MRTTFQIFTLTLIILLSAFSCKSKQGGDKDSSKKGMKKIVIENFMVRENIAGQKNTMASGLVKNPNSSKDVLLSITCDASTVTEIHEMKYEKDMMTMKKIEGGVKIPGNGEINFKSGGLHIMIIDLKKDLKAGDKVKLTFKFKNSPPQTMTVPVKTMEGMH